MPLIHLIQKRDFQVPSNSEKKEERRYFKSLLESFWGFLKYKGTFFFSRTRFGHEVLLPHSQTLEEALVEFEEEEDIDEFV